MKKYIFLFIVFLFSLLSCQKEKTDKASVHIGDFIFSTDKMSPGDEIKITYTGDGDLENSFYYFTVNNKTYPEDLDFSNEKSTFFKVPDSAQFIAFNFYVDNKLKNNKNKGYIFTLYDKNGNILPGSQAAKAIFLTYYGKRNNITFDKKALLSEMIKDFNQHSELLEKWGHHYPALVFMINKKKARNLSENMILNLTNKDKLTEEDYISIIRLFTSVKNNKKADSVKAEALKIFPNGKIHKEEMKEDLIKTFYSEKDLSKKINYYNELKEKFGDLGSQEIYMLNNLALSSYRDKNLEAFKKYEQLIDNNENKANLYNNIAWSLAEKGEDLDFAADISKKSLDLVKYLQNGNGKKPPYYSKNQYKNNLENMYRMFADTYALILFKKGDTKNAIKYQKIALEKYAQPEMKERFIEYLVTDHRDKEVIEFAEKYLQDGSATKKIKEWYQSAYMKIHPKNKDLAKRIDSLEQIAYYKMMEIIKEDMIDKPAPKFSLKDLDGNDVSLESLKGKVVILDFWATWCGPCIASFPAMQQVVNEYKNDKNVKVLFINTFERGAKRNKLVADFLKQNNYSFHVLLDKGDPETNAFEVADKYGVTGIPTKILIDPNGRIRFESVGYGGNTIKLLDEIKLMIELMKQ